MARVEDVTERLLQDASHGLGEDVRRVARTNAAKTLSPALSAFFEQWKNPGDKTIGYTSKALAYGRKVNPGAAYHQKMIRLIKGKYIRVCRVSAPPPSDSRARTESPYANEFYVMRAHACPLEIDPLATTFSGRRRR